MVFGKQYLVKYPHKHSITYTTKVDGTPYWGIVQNQGFNRTNHWNQQYTYISVYMSAVQIDSLGSIPGLLNGTVSRDILLQFFHESSSHNPQKNIWIILYFFVKIGGDIRKWSCTIGINDTGGKISAGVKYTGGKFATSAAGFVDTGVNDIEGK